MRRPAWCLFAVAAVLFGLPARGVTYEVWPYSPAEVASLASLQSGVDVGEVFCYSQFCVVLADNPVQKTNLDSLTSYWHFRVIPLLQARKIYIDNYFVQAIWDPESRTWDRFLPGLDEVPADSPQSLFAVLFKSYPNVSSPSWFQGFVDAGYVVGHPTSYQSMSYYVFGRRDLLPSLTAGDPRIRAYLEVPAGIKRADLGYYPGGADRVSLSFANVSSSEVKRRLIQRHGTLSGHCYCGYGWYCVADDLLTSGEFLEWSRLAEVINIFRGDLGGPGGGGGRGAGLPVNVPALGRFGLAALLAGIALAGWRLLRR